jgi:predicted MFS family arabinose efflux permease
MEADTLMKEGESPLAGSDESAQSLLSVMLLGLAGVLSQGMAPFIVSGLTRWGGFRSSQAGLCVSAEMTGSAIGNVVVLFALTRFNRRYLGIIALLTIIAGNVLCAAASSYVAIMGARFLAGVGCGLTTAAFGMLAATRLPVRNFAIFSGSAVVITAAFGSVASHVTATYGVRGLFILIIVPAVCALASSGVLPRQNPGSTHSAVVQRRTTFYSSLFPLLMTTFFFVAISSFWSNLSGTGAASGASTDYVTSIISMCFLLGGSLGSVVAAMLAARISRYTVIAVSLVVAALAVSLSTLFPSPAHYTVGAAAFLFLWFLNYPFLMGVLANIDPSGRLTVWGILAQSLGWMIGPAAGGILIEKGAFAMLGGFSAFCFLISLCFAIATRQSNWQARGTLLAGPSQ